MSSRRCDAVFVLAKDGCGASLSTVETNLLDMKPMSAVHLLTGGVDFLRGALDDIDDQLVSFGVAPGHRSITELIPATLQRRVK